MRSVLLTRTAALTEAGGTTRDRHVDPNRLRRLDRFGRSGVLAGSRALAAAGLAPAPPSAAPDPRFGVVVGTAFGCRDAITRHERLLASATKVEDLAPSVFVATVHNSVCGELAILYGLGGVAETLVSGRTAGLEALILAASRVAKGDADRILVVAAEGLDDEMRAAFMRENPGRTLVESAAAVLVEAAEEGDEKNEIPSSRRKRVAFVGSDLGFRAASQAVVSEEKFASEERPQESSGGVGRGGAEAPGGAVIERLGATGLWEIARDLEAARRAPAADAPHPDSPSRKIRNQRYTVHDVHGSRCAVTLAFFS